MKWINKFRDRKLHQQAQMLLMRGQRTQWWTRQHGEDRHNFALSHGMTTFQGKRVTNLVSKFGDRYVNIGKPSPEHVYVTPEGWAHHDHSGWTPDPDPLFRRWTIGVEDLTPLERKGG